MHRPVEGGDHFHVRFDIAGDRLYGRHDKTREVREDLVVVLDVGECWVNDEVRAPSRVEESLDGRLLQLDWSALGGGMACPEVLAHRPLCPTGVRAVRLAACIPALRFDEFDRRAVISRQGTLWGCLDNVVLVSEVEYRLGLLCRWFPIMFVLKVPSDRRTGQTRLAADAYEYAESGVNSETEVTEHLAFRQIGFTCSQLDT